MKAKKIPRKQVTQSEFDISFYSPVINGLTERIRDFCVLTILGRFAWARFLEVISSHLPQLRLDSDGPIPHRSPENNPKSSCQLPNVNMP